MRYVIVCVVRGEAGDFNNNLRKELKNKFSAKSSKLPAHFTIKAPFDYEENISELETAIEEFWKEEKPQKFDVEGYGHFDDRVLYMKVNMSKEGKAIHDHLIEKLMKVKFLNFDKKDGKDKIFHITLATRLKPEQYIKVYDYVKQFSCDYKCLFDNVSIYKFEDYTWKLYREFR